MLNLIPKPYKVEVLSDRIVEIGKCDNFLLENHMALLQSLHVKVAVIPDFKIDNKIEEEGYELLINTDCITIYSATNTGTFYATITLHQLILNYNHKLPNVRIIDKPNYAYRGFMLDVGRYFFPLENLMSLADLCALHKINKFHLHLTEDQGWRVEIQKYPLLTQKGSKRSHTNFNFTPHAGFYTQSELKLFVKYCHDRYIEVIPEIDMPGHSQSALACYPYLGCFDRKLPVATHWGVKHDILCAGKDSTLEFEKNVLNEIFEIFDSKYVHIGGDEAVKTRWKICPHCQSKMKELGLATEDDLQAHFINQIAEIIVKKGKTPITWNETIPSKITSKEIMWQIWDISSESETAIIDSVNNGRKSIYSVSTETYLDLPGALTSLKNCYTLPTMKKFNNNVVGIEAPLWCEFVSNYHTALKRTLPRLGALAEGMWTMSENKSYEEFMLRMDSYYKFMEKNKYRLSKLETQNPNKSRSAFQKIWFERRQLTWHGLHNLIDNAIVNNKYNH